MSRRCSKDKMQDRNHSPYDIMEVMLCAHKIENRSHKPTSKYSNSEGDEMKTLFDLMGNEDFRGRVIGLLAQNTGGNYVFPSMYPKLYRYSSLSSYSLDDIINGRITLTSVGEFNDVFEGAVQREKSIQRKISETVEKWERLERIQDVMHFKVAHKEEIVKPVITKAKRDQRVSFRDLIYFGTQVCCYSENPNSELMWAHYADNSKGICVEYDFNSLLPDNFLRYCMFPVAYTEKPIDVSDLVKNDQSLFQYSMEAALLCSTLNKSMEWNYEREWRLVWIWPFNGKEKRLSIKAQLSPSKVCLGYHFLKLLFCMSDSPEGIQACKKNRDRLLDFLLHLERKSIPLAIMVPRYGEYRLESHVISVKELYNYLIRHMKLNPCISPSLYYVIHDQLMELVDEDGNV